MNIGNKALKQVFIVNRDLKMGKGKIAVQVAHGEVEYMRHIKSIEDAYRRGITDPSKMERCIRCRKWYHDNDNMMKKVVLKATLSEIEAIVCTLEENQIWYHSVHDMGLTQVDPGSLTCVVVEPWTEETGDRLFGHLKLL